MDRAVPVQVHLDHLARGPYAQPHLALVSLRTFQGLKNEMFSLNAVKLVPNYFTNFLKNNKWMGVSVSSSGQIKYLNFNNYTVIFF